MKKEFKHIKTEKTYKFISSVALNEWKANEEFEVDKKTADILKQSPFYGKSLKQI